MRGSGATWQGPGPARRIVARPYSLKDLARRPRRNHGDRAFADDFFDKFIEGREVTDYHTLLASVGYVIRPANPDAGWIGQLAAQEGGGGITITGLASFGTPAYDAGLDTGDVITTIAGEPATAAGWNALRQRKPGESVAIIIRRRDGKTVDKTLAIKADPTLRIDPIETTGGEITVAQKAMRDAWLGSKVR